MLDFITWTASPEIYSGFVTVRWYGLMFAIGFWFGYEVVWREFRHEGVPESWVSKLFIYVIVATVVGARLGHVIFYDWAYYSHHLADIPKIWEGGLASHGGVLGIMFAIWLYSKFVTKRSMLWTFDRVVVPVGVVAALIRMGNLFNHEIYGGPTDLPWGFRFIENIPQYLAGAEAQFSVPSHPTQIYEALAYLITFAVVMWLYWKRNEQERPGLIFGVFMLGIRRALLGGVCEECARAMGSGNARHVRYGHGPAAEHSIHRPWRVADSACAPPPPPAAPISQQIP